MTEHRKNFMHMEDNEDGTFTITMYIGEIAGEVVGDRTMLVQGDLIEYLLGAAMALSEEAHQQFRRDSEMIPNNPGEVL